MSRISSRQHPLVQRCRAIAAGRGREREVLLDGEHVILEAIAAGVPVEAVLTDGRAADAARRAADTGAHVHDVPASVIDAASPVRSSSGIVAIGQWAPEPVDRAIATGPSLVIALAGVQDPGNVGSVIRSADALGASAVLVLDGSADPAGWKALRGAMGSTFHLPIGHGTVTDAMAAARHHGLRIGATVAEGGRRPERLDLTEPVMLLFGNEGAGLQTDVVSASDFQLTLPVRAGVNSLNVAVTVALALWIATSERAARATRR